MAHSHNENLYLLSWIDCVERIDTLLLEARNLQQSIIHNLHLPLLSLNLRFEEFFIWGKDWDEKWFKNKKPNEKQAADLSKLWILNYPDPHKHEELEKDLLIKYLGENYENDQYSSEYKQYKDKITKLLQRLLEKIWIEGGWSRTQRRHYHTLRAIQTLKRQVIKDKIILCQYAIDLKLYKINNSLDKAKFLIVRRAVLFNLNKYIFQLVDLKDVFNRAIDSGQQDHPKPLMERRREIGIYMDYLSDRTRDIRRDMFILFNDLQLVNKSEKSIKKLNLILHSWGNSTSSEVHFLKDTVDKQSIDYVSTHYWMPDRPDLQSVIAHEVAHGVIRDLMGNLSAEKLMSLQDDFSDLLVKILFYLGNYFKNYELQIDSPERLLQEIACDLLATAIKGFAYIYALFLESVGFALEELLMTSNREIDFSILDALEGRARGQYIRLDWYLRLKIITKWLELIHHDTLNKEEDSIENRLLYGINKLLDDALTFIDKYLRLPGDYHSTKVWFILIAKIHALIEDATVKEQVKAWRIKRRDDDIDHNTGKKGKRIYPRSMRRLDCEVRDLLLSCQLNMKIKPSRKLSNYNAFYPDDKIIRAFQNAYGVKQSFSRYCHNKHRVNLGNMYRHLYDIPWQNSYIRSIDLLEFGINSQIDNFLYQIHQDVALGRELYQIALEFHVYDVESSHHRLTLSIMLVKSVLEKIDNNNKGLKQSLETWLINSEAKFIEKTINRIKEVLRQVSTGKSYKKAILNQFKFYFKDKGDVLEEIIEKIKSIKPNDYDIKMFLMNEFKCYFEDWQQKKIDKILKIMKKRADSHIDKFNKSSVFKIIDSISAIVLNKSFSNITYALYPENYRNAERLAGFKLERLREILANFRVNNSQNEDFSKLIESLESYLSIKRIPKLTEQNYHGSVDFHLKLINSISCIALKSEDNIEDIGFKKFDSLNEYIVDSITYIAEDKDEKRNLFRVARHVLVGRIASSGILTVNFLPLENVNDKLTDYTIDLINEGSDRTKYQYSVFNKENIYTLQPVLGRYDAIFIGSTKSLCRCLLPYFQTNDTKNKSDTPFDVSISNLQNLEKFPSYFSRREMGIEINYPFKWNSKVYRKCVIENVENVENVENKKLPDYFAYIVIDLQRRSYRLSFLYRLLSSIEKINREYSEEMEGPFKIIEDIGGFFKPLEGDSAYLMTGSGDILLAFAMAKKTDQSSIEYYKYLAERMKHIFIIQNVIYEDFMTDRTEIIFARECSIAALYYNLKKEETFKIYIRFRMVENRLLSHINNDFEKDVLSNSSFLTELFNRFNLKWPPILIKQPGRMDYALDLILNDEEDMDREKAISELEIYLNSIEHNDFINSAFKKIQANNIDRIETSIGLIKGKVNFNDLSIKT